MNFFHQIGIEWTICLPDNTQVSFYDSMATLSHRNYAYPDEDFCLFADWPHNKHILPLFDPSQIETCTNTLAWLIQKYPLINETTYDNMIHYIIGVKEKCDNALTSLNLTYFAEKIDICKIRQSSKSAFMQKLSFEYYDMQITVLSIQDLVVFVCMPCACILGLILNIRVIQVIRKNKKKDLKEDFYSYMSLNSKFNCTLCLLFAFYPINYCNQFKSDLFCSSIYNSLFDQYFKIYFVAYSGEAIKMCSNISYILITVNRYMLIGNEHSPFLERISKLKIRNVFVASFLVSFLLNIGHIFQFKISGFNSISDPHNTKYLPSYNMQYDYAYPIVVNANTALSAYLCFYFVINFVTFFIINTTVEVNIVRRLRKELAEKKLRMEQMNQVVSMRTRRTLDQDSKKELRAIVMVISNSVLNFFLRFPEILVFLSSMSNYFKDLEDTKNIHNHYFSSDGDYFNSLLVDVSNLTFILTFSTNVAMFFLFNTKFKQAFKLRSNVKKK